MSQHFAFLDISIKKDISHINTSKNKVRIKRGKSRNDKIGLKTKKKREKEKRMEKGNQKGSSYFMNHNFVQVSIA